ncbi:cytochrome P450 family protein [Hyphomonas neptunium ATCC 15444]|uniref:Cytochrome P450 family protein n=2 Tax=Hyphomonas TaxID=85 RepID=Q0C040_HYPNA|nr:MULTISPECIES: cytochrome P450 [Hyphomonas]ABI76490.1 cytochrome P450 family protein [Hyphomonas neptunium ATCC 15444]KCZ90514.1 cytochrome P450 family protein [Hyphomonas hirschiana VP5]
MDHSHEASGPDLPDWVSQRLVSPKAYATDQIDEAYRWARTNNPLGVARAEGYDPFWVLTKHDDILTVSRNNSLFHSADRATTLLNQAAIERTTRITGGSPNLVRSLVQMDAPDHMKYRTLTQGWFMPANLRKREEEVGQIADAAVASFLKQNGRCDFVRDVALNYPLHVVMNILGVPPEDFPRMLRLTQELFGSQDPDTARQLDALSAEQFGAMIQAVVQDFAVYFNAISEDRRRDPKDDLATIIANATIDGRPIGPMEATSYYIIVATAGHDTTSSATSMAMWALATQAGLLQRLQAQPESIPGFVEEAIRWATPVKTFMRSATKDTELRGRRIAKGDWLMLCYASGNRDEEVFSDPYTFDIDRKPNRQLAFGNGAHVCIGQHLARLEMRVLFEKLIPALKSVSLDGDIKFVESYFVSGPKTLPIRFEVM